MRRIQKNIIITAAVIVLLIVAAIIVIRYIAVVRMSGANSSGKSVYTIYSEDTRDIAYVEVSNETETIRAENLGNAVWTVNNMSSYEVDLSKAYGLAGTVSTLTSKNKIEDSDLSKYGLDNPSVTVTISKKNGDSDTLYIGGKTPEYDEYYIKKSGDDAIYTVYAFKVETLKQPLKYYTEFNRFNVNSDDILGITIIKSDELIDISKNKDDFWEMSSPYLSAANNEYVERKILSKIEEIDLSEPLEDVEAGITSTFPVVILSVEPYNNITGEYGDIYTETVIIGKTFGDSAYVKYRNNIYSVSADSVGFVSESAYSIINKMQAFADMEKIKSVTLEYEGAVHTLAIENGREVVFTLDGEETDKNASMTVCNKITGLSVDGIYNNETMGDTVLKISYKGIKSADNLLVEFKEIGDESCAVVRDGVAQFTIKKSKIDDFIELFNEYAENPQAE
ncbi:MAG: DUF4340 domain-containing protein [Firmicutes bacterium]|nr:DUF4340 domain-containing protein [Bacillota bacterium]